MYLTRFVCWEKRGFILLKLAGGVKSQHLMKVIWYSTLCDSFLDNIHFLLFVQRTSKTFVYFLRYWGHQWRLQSVLLLPHVHTAVDKHLQGDISILHWRLFSHKMLRWQHQALTVAIQTTVLLQVSNDDMKIWVYCKHFRQSSVPWNRKAHSSLHSEDKWEWAWTKQERHYRVKWGRAWYWSWGCGCD